LPSGARDAPGPRDFRDRPLGRAAIVAVALLAIFLVARGCQREGTEISEDEAVAIAREAVDFEPDKVVVRFMRRGTSFAPHWAVSLSQETEGGELARVTVVVVNARTGDVVEIRS
jgi:hypothetical protein